MRDGLKEFLAVSAVVLFSGTAGAIIGLAKQNTQKMNLDHETEQNNKIDSLTKELSKLDYKMQ